MAKKDNHVSTAAQDSVLAANSFPPEVPVLYESEAYGDPEPDAAASTTVTKPVGIGGPVPIVAPKGNTIQLQPIIVPLAVVPYMTQDSDVLRTEGGAAAIAQPEYASGAVEFDRAERKKAARTSSKAKVENRVFSAVMFILAALGVVAYLLAYFKPDIHPEYTLAQVDAIGGIIAWANGDLFDLSLTLVNAVGAVAAAVLFIVSLAALIAGRYPRKTLAVFSLIGAAAYAAEIAHQEIAGHFNAAKDAETLTMLALFGLIFIVSVIFLAACVRREDKEDTVLRSRGEI